MQVTNGSVTLELQKSNRLMKIRQTNEDTGQPWIHIRADVFYVVHDDGKHEIIGDVFPANGWSEVGVAPAPVEEAPVEEAPVEEEAVVEETVVEEAVEEAPAPVTKKPRKRLGRRR